VSAPELPRSARRVHAALEDAGVDAEIRLVGDAHTAPEAAAIVGCELGAIVKTLVFRAADGGQPVLVLVSGSNRADEALLGVSRADAGFVREVTGFAIGGVPPVAHAVAMRVLVDPDLLTYDEVWCAGGTPNTLFPIAPSELVRVTGGEVTAVA
jgi:prolyl-tRNA editing enzyme YbaK/EbsC (Cys-tRNA(Pro) deacylase)